MKIKHGKLERPKLIFVTRKFTVLDLKYYIIKIFAFLKESKPRNFRLWVLDSNVIFDQFEEYVLKSTSPYLNRKRSYINFPGILLDNYENNLIGELEEIIQNKVVVLENLESSLNESIQFNKQGYNYQLKNSIK